MLIIRPTNVCLEEVCKTKEDVFTKLSEMAFKSKLTHDRKILGRAFSKSEATYSSSFRAGFALPQAISVEINEPQIFFLKVFPGVEWSSMSGQLVQYVVAFAIPKLPHNNEGFDALALFEMALEQPELVKKITESTTVQEVVNAVEWVLYQAPL